MYIWISKTKDMKTSKIELTQKELKVLTWMDDVTGMVANIEGDEVVIFYEAMPEYWETRISLDEVIATIEDMKSIQIENN